MEKESKSKHYLSYFVPNVHRIPQCPLSLVENLDVNSIPSVLQAVHYKVTAKIPPLATCLSRSELNKNSSLMIISFEVVRM